MIEDSVPLLGTGHAASDTTPLGLASLLRYSRVTGPVSKQWVLPAVVDSSLVPSPPRRHKKKDTELTIDQLLHVPFFPDEAFAADLYEPLRVTRAEQDIELRSLVLPSGPPTATMSYEQISRSKQYV